MNVYFSGIGGVGLGPLASIANDAGFNVSGSDKTDSLMTNELQKSGINISLDQTGQHLKATHTKTPIDWLVYTAGLPPDHPELQLAHELGIKTTKRDELLSHIINQKNLQLIAVSGSHGKTTTTGMLIWTMKALNIPISYSIGTTLSWGKSGQYDPNSKYFIYECDEFDRNFLHFQPHLSIITSIEHDHPDTYPTEAEYYQAFSQFISQSKHTIMWADDAKNLQTAKNSWLLNKDEIQDISLIGEHNRRNGTLVLKAIEYLQAQSHSLPLHHEDSAFPAVANQDQINQLAVSGSEGWNGKEMANTEGTSSQAQSHSERWIDEEMANTRRALESFPGTGRRFEKLATNLYTDYGHTPTEIAATLQLAREINDQIVLVYQPHQNTRQHEIKDQYKDQFEQADTVYWLPTYITRDDPNLEILTPEQLTSNITNKDDITIAEPNDDLWSQIQKHRDDGALVLCMGAGTIDGWVRDKLG